MGKILTLMLFLSLNACAKPSAQNSCSFVRNKYNERVSWKATIPVTLTLHESFPREFRDAALFAVRAWNLKVGKTLLILSDKTAYGPNSPARDNSNNIYYQKNYTGPDVEQGRTNLVFMGDQIKEADIVLNATNFVFYTKSEYILGGVNLETLLIHEMGHVLGLDHIQERDNIMHPYLPFNVDRSNLLTFDTKILKCEY